MEPPAPQHQAHCRSQTAPPRGNGCSRAAESNLRKGARAPREMESVIKQLLPAPRAAAARARLSRDAPEFNVVRVRNARALRLLSPPPTESPYRIETTLLGKVSPRRTIELDVAHGCVYMGDGRVTYISALEDVPNGEADRAELGPLALTHLANRHTLKSCDIRLPTFSLDVP